MALSEILLPSGQLFKFGRTRPDPGARKLHLKNYVSAALPAPPSRVSYSPSGGKALSDVYLNNQLGDCVIAALLHMLGVWTGNATGTPFVATDDQVTQMYSAVGGYVPGRPGTDNGCNELDALNYCVQTGFPSGDRLLGYLAIDATDWTLVKQALWLFETLLIGVELPRKWTGSAMPQANGFVWDLAGAPDPNQGHGIMAAGYDDAAGLEVDTWALLGHVTPRAAARYFVSGDGGELYAALTEAMLVKATMKSPTGIDLLGLITDMNAAGASIPAPDVPPDPLPPLPIA